MSEEEYEDEEECECGTGTENSADWMKTQIEFLKKIKKFKVKEGDRLHSIAELSFMHKILCDTVFSWNNWVNGWVSIEIGKKIKVAEANVVTLSDAEVKVLHAKYKDFVMKFLEMDLEITAAFTKRINELNEKKSAVVVNAPPCKNPHGVVV